MPAALDVSEILVSVDVVRNGLENMFFSYFVEFVSHDLSSTVFSLNVDECECDSENPKCFSIPIRSGGQNMKFKRDCLNFVRSLDSAEAFDCVFDHREQLSNTSHWLDLSNFYGSNIRQSELFRAYKSGKLKNDIVSRAALKNPCGFVEISHFVSIL